MIKGLKTIAVIPARLESQRFPNKLIQPLGEYSIIQQTFLSVQRMGILDEVWVATDSPIIQEQIQKIGGQVYMSQQAHSCGSDRIAEAVAQSDADVVINVQGDEPFTEKKLIQELIDVFANDTEKSIDLASPYHILEEDIENPNYVKVVTDNNDFALYFSRSVIPYPRNPEEKPIYKRHIGIYAFRKNALMEFYKAHPTPLELAEQIEAIRYLEMGKRMKMIPSDSATIGIDTPEDYQKALEKIKN